MNIWKLSLPLLSLTLFTFSQASAAQASSFDAYGLFSLPVGEFGQTNASGSFAEPGFGAAFDWTQPVSPSAALSWLASEYDIFNGFNTDALNQQGSGDETVSGGSFFDIPLMVGLQFQPPIANVPFKVYGLAELGVNLQGISDQTVTDEEGNSTDVSYDPAFSFAFCVGGGIKVDEHLNIGFRYLNLGSPTHTITVTDDQGDEGTGSSAEVSTNMFAFLLGWEF